MGIDVEVPNDRVNYRGIASQVLSPSERQVWDAVTPARQIELLMQIWVCKESLLKAMGLGIAEGLHKLSLPLPLPQDEAFVPARIDPTLQLHIPDDGTCRMTSWIDAKSWRLIMLTEKVGYFAAITTERRVSRLEIHGGTTDS